VVFCATSGGVEHVWATDGTPKGTKPILTAGGGCNNAVHTVGGRGYFAYAGATGGNEPWVTDGTAVGTIPLGDLNPGDDGSYPDRFTPCGGKICFAAIASAMEVGLLVTDGTRAGTHRLDLSAKEDPLPGEMLQVGARAFFQGYTASTGAELWVTDGTADGTAMVKVINPSGILQTRFAVRGDLAYFAADDGAHGLELWVTDGTADGSLFVANSLAGHIGTEPVLLETLHGWEQAELVGPPSEVLFAGWDPVHGTELWRSDGTEAGTGMVVDLAPGEAWSFDF
jgi:ELWxxDGT repeat protein